MNNPTPAPLHDDGGRLVWRVSTGYPKLTWACKAAGLDNNAVVFDTLAPDTDLSEANAWLEFPSFFCNDRKLFVFVLAYLVRRAEQFTVSIRQRVPGKRDQDAFMNIYPRLDAVTLKILNEIDPAHAATIKDLNWRIETVFERLRKQVTIQKPQR